MEEKIKKFRYLNSTERVFYCLNKLSIEESEAIFEFASDSEKKVLVKNQNFSPDFLEKNWGKLPLIAKKEAVHCQNFNPDFFEKNWEIFESDIKESILYHKKLSEKFISEVWENLTQLQKEFALRKISPEKKNELCFLEILKGNNEFKKYFEKKEEVENGI